MKYTKIDICIATYQRASLTACLQSLVAQLLPDNVRIEIIVADNDQTPSAAKQVAAVQAATDVKIHYVHAPARNISIARNACLDQATGDFIAFIDDDEIAPPHWLATLLEAIAGYTAVFGPAIAKYPDGAPGWMVQQQYHDNLIVRRGGIVQTGHTCNALVRRGDATVKEERFDLALGRTGGEDTAYFFQIFHRGGRFEACDEAPVYEDVAKGRLSFKWLADRQFRAGQTYARAAPREVLWRKVALTGLAAIKALFCGAMAVMFFWSIERRAYWALRGMLHAGVVAGSFGARHLSLY